MNYPYHMKNLFVIRFQHLLFCHFLSHTLSLSPSTVGQSVSFRLFNCLCIFARIAAKKRFAFMKMSFSIFSIMFDYICKWDWVWVCVCMSRACVTFGMHKRHQSQSQRKEEKSKYVIIIVKREIIGQHKNWIYIQLGMLKWRH